MTKPPAPPPYRQDTLIKNIAQLCKVLPRAKGFLPRWIGRIFKPLFKNKYVVTRYGTKLTILPDSLEFYTTMEIWNNSWEHWVFDTLRWVIPDDGVFYDVGANVGYMSLELATVKKDVTVYAFEPQPTAAQNIQESIALGQFDERITVFQVAVSDQHNQPLVLATTPNSVHAKIIGPSNSQPSINVRSATLDGLMIEGAIEPPDLIKLDVEGHELKALKGAQKVLESAGPHIVFECNNISELNALRDLLLTFHNYRFFYAVGSYRELLEIGDTLNSDEKLDVIAINVDKISLPAKITRYLEEHSDTKRNDV